MRYSITLGIAMLVVSVAGAPLLAQRGNGQGPVNKPQAQPHPAGKPAGTPGNPKGDRHTSTTGTTTSRTTNTTASTTTHTTVTTTTPTSVKNPALEQRLQALLPGTNVSDAAKGFKNWGQFVAAVHVSHNLNIPFADLKTKMTGPQPMSLGQAIQALKPAGTTTTTTTTKTTTSVVETEVRRAESEADEDFRVARR